MKLYQLGKGVCNYYINNVNGNEDTSHEMVQRKLTRNIHLSYKVSDALYIYGHLHIKTKGNMIVSIKNHHSFLDTGFQKDLGEYERLNRLLKIS